MVRAVLEHHAPGAPVVELSHGVPAFDVRAGALLLQRAAPHLGPGVVLGIVDPGVGGPRTALALALAGDRGPRAMVGPDNGLLLWAADLMGGVQAAVALAPSASSSTFDGRDVFAPAAAALWQGASVGDLGEPVSSESLVRLTPPRRTVADGELVAEVQWVDRFGNVQLSATTYDLQSAGLGSGALQLADGSRTVPLRAVRSFAELVGDDAGLLVDANGMLAVVTAQRSAATVLGVGPGDLLVIRASAP